MHRISAGAEPKALRDWSSTDEELLAWAHRTPAQREADEQNRLANLYVGNPVTDLYMHEDDPIEDTANAIEAEQSVERLNLEIRRARKNPSTHVRDAYLAAHPDPGPIPSAEDIFKAQRTP
jgi:hypothetical protein